VSWDWLSLWSSGISSGRIALLDKSVDADSPGASSRVGFNLVTLALSKHFTDWLQVGAGGILVDYNAIGGGGAPLIEEDGTQVRNGFLALLPYANVEARAGEHFRLVGELLYRGGVSIGLRTLLFGSRQFDEIAGIRTSGWRVRLDTAAILTNRDTGHGSELAVLPWIGVGLYPR
jgi:hypothetical protein